MLKTLLRIAFTLAAMLVGVGIAFSQLSETEDDPLVQMLYVLIFAAPAGILGGAIAWGVTSKKFYQSTEEAEAEAEEEARLQSEKPIWRQILDMLRRAIGL